MAHVKYTVSVEAELVERFKAVCKERGRSQSFYVTACMRRVVGDSSSRHEKGAKSTKKGPTLTKK